MRMLSFLGLANRRLIWRISAAIAATLLSSHTASAHDHYGKTVALLAMDTRPCTFFTLNGVTMADPALPAAAQWFALPKANANYGEMNAMLLSAKLSGKLITVRTNGTFSCGHATVEWLNLD